MIPSCVCRRRISSAKLDANEGVERRERLVEEENARLDREGLRERDALLHAARELVRVALRGLREADELDELGTFCRRSFRRRRGRAARN